MFVITGRDSCGHVKHAPISINGAPTDDNPAPVTPVIVAWLLSAQTLSGKGCDLTDLKPSELFGQ